MSKGVSDGRQSAENDDENGEAEDASGATRVFHEYTHRPRSADHFIRGASTSTDDGYGVQP